MSPTNTNTQDIKSVSATAFVKQGGSKACTPFKLAASNASNGVQVNAARKPVPGLKVITASGGTTVSPPASVTVNTVTCGVNTPTHSTSISAASTAYPSDEENVRPAQGRESDQAQAPLSPLLKDRERERDVRAYEHERQRTKRAGEWAVRRARKAGVGRKTKVPVMSAEAGAGVGERKTGVHRHRQRGDGEEVNEEYVLGGVGVGRIAGGPGTAAFSANKGKGGLEGALAAASTFTLISVGTIEATARVDVSLSDLVVPSRSAKSKLRTRTVTGEEEFEWVPALKAVIALDEEEFGKRDMEVDEPWECVGEAEEREKNREKVREPSYAEVLTGM